MRWRSGWPARSWTREALERRFGERWVKTNASDPGGHTVRLQLRDYLAYSASSNDEKPVYLFDNKFQVTVFGDDITDILYMYRFDQIILIADLVGV